jgi:hypothetical protein
MNSPNLAPNIYNFIGNVALPKLIENETSLKVIAEERISLGGFLCSGWYDAEKRELVVCSGKPVEEWASILVHEFGHFLQYIYNDPIWNAQMITFMNKQSHVVEMIDAWLEGKDFDLKDVQEWVRLSFECEMDCESKVLEMNNVYSIGFNEEWYTKRANSYLVLYPSMLKNRMWSNKAAPYKVDAILDSMPGNRLVTWDEAQKLAHDLDETFLAESLGEQV